MSESFAERVLRPEQARLERFEPRSVAPGRSLAELCARALSEPIGSPPLSELARGARRIAVIVSDATRDEPRAEMLHAIFEQVPPERALLVVASGTHDADASAIPAAFSGLPALVHDARDARRMRDLGTTSRGTRVRLLGEVAEADLVIVTGRIRPHYFAGFSGGVKGVFPGVALGEDALANHRLKADRSARLGCVEDNVCRLDMEEAALRVPAPIFALNVLLDVEGNAVAARAGHPIAAHRELVPLARQLFGVEAPRSPVVVVADRPPVSRSLYQASKLLAPAGAVLEPGGSLILVAECDLGTGPVERVNDGIYRLGIAPQLPADHHVILVSLADPADVATSYAEAAPSLSAALDRAFARQRVERAVLLWRAGECIARALHS